MAVAKATTQPPGRRQPRTRELRKGDLKERAILETLGRLLGERTLAQIGVEELASGAGISRPTFYFYFESKAAALRALVQQISDAMFAALETTFETLPDDPREATRRSIAASAEQWQRHGPVLRAAVQGRATLPELREAYERMFERFVDASAAQIERQRAAGNALRGSPSPRELATVLIGMNERAFYAASLCARPSLGPGLVDTLTEVWTRAVLGTGDEG